VNWDVQILDQSGYDVLEGLGMNRSDVLSQQTAILYASTSVNPVVDESDALTLVVGGNTVASAFVGIDLYYALGA